MDDPRDLYLTMVLEGCRLNYIDGAKSALLVALDLCFTYKLDVPSWVANEFVVSYRKWKTLEVKTLDEAFEVKRKVTNKDRKWMNKAYDVYLAFLDNESRGLALDTGFERGEVNRFGINNDDAWKMYKEIRKNTVIGIYLETTRKKPQ